MGGLDQRGDQAEGLSQSRLLLVTGLLVALILATTLGIALVKIYQSDVIMPGVQVQQTSLGGRSVSEASADLEHSWKSSMIQVGEGDKIISLPAENLGIVLDAEATAQRAHQEGRSPNRLERVISGDWSLEVEPVWNFDADAAEASLLDLADDLSLPAVNAGIRMVNGKVETTAPVIGRQLDVPATLSQMEQDLERIVAEGRFVPVTVPVKAQVDDVSAALREAQNLLENTLTIRLHDSLTGETLLWVVEPTEWSQWAYLGVTRDNPPSLLWDLDPAEVKVFLLEQAQSLEPDRSTDIEAAVVAVILAAAEGIWQANLDLVHSPQ